MPVSRFYSTRAVVAYVGFDPVEDSSAARRRIGSISKEGSRLLRFLLNEAGHTTCRKDPELKRFYQRLVHRRGRPKAKVAVARNCWCVALSCCTTRSTTPNSFGGVSQLDLPGRHMGLICLSSDWAIGLSRQRECELDFMSLSCSHRCLIAAL
jgi:hypothetical protein